MGYVYTFQQINIGDGGRVNIASPDSSFGTLVAQIHTHAAYSRLLSITSETFTQQDFSTTRPNGVGQFLATPGGRLIYAAFDPDANWFKPIIVITRDLPEDTLENYNQQHGR